MVALFVRWVKAVFTPKPPAPDPLLTLLEVHQTQQQEMVKNMMSVVEKMTDATTAQAQAFSDYLSLFKVTEAPVSRTMRDADEYELELVRKGYPVRGSAEEQAKWVLEQSRY